MKIEEMIMPNGVTIKAAIIHRSESCYHNDSIINYNEVCYAQNRIFLRDYELEYWPTREGGWEKKFTREPNITVLCDYAVIPELDKILI